MIEHIDRNIYRIEIPLPNSPLKATNSYLIRGYERNLLIDTGFNRPECRDAMDTALRSLDVSMDNTDLFLTHIHADHTGLAGYLASPSTVVYCGKFYDWYLKDPAAYTDDDFRGMVIQGGLQQMGISPDDSSIHPGYEFAPDPIKNLKVLSEGDSLDVGDLHLQVLETTGHTPDHLCLYDEKSKLLVSGDHILGSITPNNTLWETPWEAENDYLGSYLTNLDKIDKLQIDLTLPGHRALIQDCHQRIEELRQHHERRLNLVLKILSDGKAYTGAQVAERMRWDIKAKSWDDFPQQQKFFATGEALSHLTHLIFRGEVRKELIGDVVYYSRIK